MGYGVTLQVSGDYALFTRPELKGERVSYDVITPSAARGVLEAVLWKPAIRWVVDRITVLNPIEFESIRRNEVGSKIPPRNVTAAMSGSNIDLHQYTGEDRQQRTSLVLRNVSYLIDAHFTIVARHAGENDTPEKFYNMFLRRARQGQCFHNPYLGCREFAARFKLIETTGKRPESFYANEADYDLGWMLWDIDYNEEPKQKRPVYTFTPRFFEAKMRNGIIEVPPEVNT
ncbi:type I-C CRISPR-associated protein Cas5c [Cohnella sp. 56]|uniref:type I-C CRISPR-associated protein Cas5c n=1 Tax=Cohnella sp. 56 TaxID=3113722 RepID=UPI0030E826B2